MTSRLLVLKYKVTPSHIFNKIRFTSPIVFKCTFTFLIFLINDTHIFYNFNIVKSLQEKCYLESNF